MDRLRRLAVLEGVLHDVNIQRGSVWQGISTLLEALDIDLIVLGTRGRRGLEHVLLGSVAEQVFRRAFCLVLTVGPKVRTSGLTAGELATVLYATDFSLASSRALDYALALVRAARGKLILLHAVQDSTEVVFKYLDEALGEARRRLSGLLPQNSAVGCQVVAQCGPAADVILRVARESNADLIVMGAHGGSSVWAHVPWAVAHAVVCGALSPVLTVRA
jgi:nucleotide-binding universal stress UspA family protein